MTDGPSGYVESNVFYDAFHELTRVGDRVAYIAGGSQYGYLRKGVVERVFKRSRSYGRDRHEIWIRFAPAEKGKPGVGKTTHVERVMKLDGA